MIVLRVISCDAQKERILQGLKTMDWILFNGRLVLHQKRVLFWNGYNKSAPKL